MQPGRAHGGLRLRPPPPRRLRTHRVLVQQHVQSAVEEPIRRRVFHEPVQVRRGGGPFGWGRVRRSERHYTIQCSEIFTLKNEKFHTET